MAISLPANKALAALSNVAVLFQNSDQLSGDGVAKLLAVCKDTDIESGGVKVITSADIEDVHDLDVDDTQWLGSAADPRVHEQTMAVDTYKVIKLRLSQYLTKTAFASDSICATFLGYVRGTMQKAKDFFLYRTLIDKIEAYTPVTAGLTDYKGNAVTRLGNVNIPLAGLDTKAGRQEDAEKLASSLINITKQFNAPSPVYNDLGYTEIVSPKDMTLIVNSDFSTLLTVDTFATMFNSAALKPDMAWGDTVEIPSSQLAGAGKANEIGWLFGKGKVQYGFSYQLDTSIFNPANLTDNAFVHFAYYCGTADAVPAIKLTKTAA